jgi:hypothetical protein
VSTIGAAAHVFPTGATPKEAAALYRMVQIRSWMWWALGVQAASMAASGHPTWENKRDIFRIERPISKDLRMEYNPLKHFGEFYHAVSDPMKFAANKTAFLPKAVVEAVTGNMFGTGQAISKKKGLAAAPDYFQHFAESASPISLSNLSDSRMSVPTRAGAVLSSIAGLAPIAVNPRNDPKPEKSILTSILKDLSSL